MLAGAGVGRRTCMDILNEVGIVREPTVCLLDLSNVDVATTSFLREAVLRLRDAARAQGSPICFVVANASDEVREELDDLLRRSGDALPACRTDAQGTPFFPDVLGELDDKQQRTLDLLRDLGEADASTLQKMGHPDEGVGQTAWNNRLAALSAKGLVIEQQHGRSKRYRPVLQGL